MKLPSLLYFIAVFLTIPLSAQVPNLINYQGRVAVGGVNFDGSGNFKFALVGSANRQATASVALQFGNYGPAIITVIDGGAGYDTAPVVSLGFGQSATAVVSGGAVVSITSNNPNLFYSFVPTITIAPPSATSALTAFWSNDGTSANGNEPTYSVSLPVNKGLYSVLLGDATLTNMLAIPTSVFTHREVSLRVWFDDGTHGFQLLTPDQRIAAAGYAMMAANVPDGSITTAKLADSAVTGAKMAAFTITSREIADGVITASKIPYGSITADQIAANAVTNREIAPGTIGEPWLANGSVTTAKIANVAVTTDKIAANAVTNREIVPGTIEEPWLANDAVTSAKIKNSAVTGDKIAFQTITGFNIADGTIYPQKLDTNSVWQMNGLNLGNFYNEKISLQGGLNHYGIGVQADTLFQRSDVGFAWFVGGVFAGAAGDPGAGGTSAMTLDNNKLRVYPNGIVNALTLGDAPNGKISGLVRLFNEVSVLGRDSVSLGISTESGAQTVAKATADGVFKIMQPTGHIETPSLVITGGADVAEPFTVSDDNGLQPGDVLIIDEDEPGHLKRSNQSYDPRVAGIVSGAGGVKPGLTLHQEGVVEGGHQVALTGRVYVKADTSQGNIKPGDLLTTSVRRGYAARASDVQRAPGAIIGKAMSRLETNEGLVLVLVSLQ